MSESLSAGAFARQSRLSAKALRLYAANGILVPDRVDADTGYRHYSLDQLQDARLVHLLRRSAVPLAVVAEILDAPREQRSALVERYAEQSEAELRRRLQLLAHLSRTFSGGKDSYPMSNIRTRNVPDQTVLTEQAYMLAAYDALNAWIDASDATMGGPPRELYFADPSTGPEDEPVADVAIPIAS
ncbi:MAG: MerR family transcriptional regulator [Leifsonia sp.]